MPETNICHIRVATPADAEALLAIYAPYVRETAITFEWDVPSVEEFRTRIERTLEKYPYLVAETDGRIVGYTYAGPFHDRAAYDWAVETAIYVVRGGARHGVGRQLYAALEAALAFQNIQNLNACIAYPAEADAHLTRNSAEFHAHMGYRMVGEFHKCGYKFGHWYDMVWMEKAIGDHPDTPAPVRWFADCRDELTAACGLG